MLLPRCFEKSNFVFLKMKIWTKKNLIKTWNKSQKNKN